MAAVGTQPLRIVLFGKAGAGKSSLLEALAPTSEPAVRHVQFIDCDGNAAIRLLAVDSPAFPPGQLADELRCADALILVIPVDSLNDEELDQYERFLHRLEAERGNAIHVGGIPVLLALSKCDLLAEPGDTPTAWQKRVADRIETVDRRFQRFRRERSARGLPYFGQLTLAPAQAIATRAPGDGNGQQAFGMAGLFRQAAAEAARYRASGRHSTGRLLWLATVLLLIIAGLVGFGIYRGGVTSQADQEAMRAAIDSQVRWYQELRDQAGALDSYTEFQPEEGGRVPWTSWNKKVEELFAAAGTPRFALEEKLPGADRATYQAIAEAVPIREARIDWTDAASRLQRRRDLVAALGLIGPSSDRPAVLQIPPPPDFTVAQAQLAWDSFQKHYPNSADWSLDGLPAGVAREISAAAQTSNQHLLLAGRNEILWKLDRLTPDGKETPALWRELRAWLRMPTELTAWRRLTLFALRLTDPAADDPIDALATFLDRNQHEIELQRLVLRVPAGAKLTPDGKLTIYHGRSDDVENKLAFVPLGEPRRDDDGTTRYTFVPEAGESLTLRIRYRPGDTLWAELPVQMADRQPRLLTWSLCRSQVFQFERLVRPPRLHRKDQQATEGELLPDVALIVAVGLVPRLPELIPVVKLSRR